MARVGTVRLTTIPRNADHANLNFQEPLRIRQGPWEAHECPRASITWGYNPRHWLKKASATIFRSQNRLITLHAPTSKILILILAAIFKFVNSNVRTLTLENSNFMKSSLRQISDVEISQLRVFKTVVTNGGFLAAQLELGLSRSTISGKMTELETRLGLSLC
jgi:hypothetical protein